MMIVSEMLAVMLIIRIKSTNTFKLLQSCFENFNLRDQLHVEVGLTNSKCVNIIHATYDRGITLECYR